MSEIKTAMRKERIERLLHELEYEVTRGVMENEIEEDLYYSFYIPSRAAKHVNRVYELRSRIMDARYLMDKPRLSVVK